MRYEADNDVRFWREWWQGDRVATERMDVRSCIGQLDVFGLACCLPSEFGRRLAARNAVLAKGLYRLWIWNQRCSESCCWVLAIAEWGTARFRRAKLYQWDCHDFGCHQGSYGSDTDDSTDPLRSGVSLDSCHPNRSTQRAPAKSVVHYGRIQFQRLCRHFRCGSTTDRGIGQCLLLQRRSGTDRVQRHADRFEDGLLDACTADSRRWGEKLRSKRDTIQQCLPESGTPLVDHRSLDEPFVAIVDMHKSAIIILLI